VFFFFFYSKWAKTLFSKLSQKTSIHFYNF